MADHPDLHGGELEVAFTAALDRENLLEFADARATAALRAALANGDRDRVHELADQGQIPLLLGCPTRAF